MYSFVVPAYNEERFLGETLAAIHAAAREAGIAYEIVVADDASTDGTAGIAIDAGARVVRVEHRKISATRNSGAAAARGDRLVFVDADTLIDATVLRAARAALDAGAIGGGAHVRVAGEVPRWARWMLRAVIGLMRFFRWAAGCFVFCTREAFAAVGGFDERHFAAEEIALSAALKHQGRFVILPEYVRTSPRKLAHHSPWRTLCMVLRMGVRGRSGMQRRDLAGFWYDGKR
jgi:glycosyltransferase involved in cell wall biosynthesis